MKIMEEIEEQTTNGFELCPQCHSKFYDNVLNICLICGYNEDGRE